MKKLPYCSVLVLNWNGKKWLNDCFRSLRKINYPKSRYEVIMIDNASSDDSVAYVKKKFPWVKICKLDKNYGFDEGYNMGIEKSKAKGDYLVILNNDTEVEKDWLIEMVEVAEKDKSIGVCGSKIVDERLGEVGEGYMSLLGVPIQKAGDNVKECFWISDCSALIRRVVKDKMGKIYDDDFFIYFEEIDVCWRARLLGYKVVFVPKSVVYHKGAATASRVGWIMKFYHYRNKIWTFRKNTRPPFTQLLMVPISITAVMMILYFTARGEWDYGITPLKYMFTKKEKSKELKGVSLKDQIRMFFIK